MNIEKHAVNSLINDPDKWIYVRSNSNMFDDFYFKFKESIEMESCEYRIYLNIKRKTKGIFRRYNVYRSFVCIDKLCFYDFPVPVGTKNSFHEKTYEFKNKITKEKFEIIKTIIEDKVKKEDIKSKEINIKEEEQMFNVIKEALVG